MDREALVLYLQNVRDLEVAKRIIVEKYNAKKSYYVYRKQRVHITPQFQKHRNRPEKQDKNIRLGAGIALMAFIMGIIFIFITTFIGVVFIIAAIGLFIKIFVEQRTAISDYRHAVAAWEAYEKTVDPTNEKERRRVEEAQKQLQKIEADWQQTNRYYTQEYQKVCKLLEDFYGMNLISSEYRNHLAAIQYIYEVASTTQLSYEQILFQTKIEDGIRRIESKLDQMIRQLEDVVYETRCMREENRQSLQAVIRQNEGMLAHLQSVETNSRLTAQYAQLSANYSKANAYFSLASYLKD